MIYIDILWKQKSTNIDKLCVFPTVYDIIAQQKPVYVYVYSVFSVSCKASSTVNIVCNMLAKG